MNRRQRIAYLKQYSQFQLYTFLRDNQGEFFGEPGSFRDVLYYSDPKSLPLISSLISTHIVKILEANTSTLTKNYWGNAAKHSMEYPRLIDLCASYITTEAKSKVLDIILKYQNNFTSNGRKSLSRSAVDFVSDEDSRAIEIFRTFYRILPKKSVDDLMTKIDGGMDHPEIKKVLKRTKRYQLYKYPEEETLNNHERRIELLKDLARTPSLIKKLEYDFHVTVDDIKEIAPAMRFKFLQFAFRKELYATKYASFYRPDSVKKDIENYRNRQKLKMPLMSMEEIKDILFSVSISKNEEVVRWLGQYEKMLDFANGVKK